jgi:hypothetical protein
MNLCQKDFSLTLQGLQQRQRLAIQPIHANPLEVKSELSGVAHYFQRQLELGSMDLLRFRNARFIATLRILRPLLGQIQPRINQTDSIPLAESTEDADLAIFLFSKASIPLPRNPNGFIAFLLKGTFIEIQTSTDVGPHAGISIPGHLVHNTTVFPSRMRQEILQHLLVTVRNRFGHALHVALPRLYQSAQVLLGRLDHTVVARLEQLRKRLGKPPVNRTQLLGEFPIATPIF